MKVQNRGMSGHKNSTEVLKKFKKKKFNIISIITAVEQSLTTYPAILSLFFISRAVLWCLTWNSLGTEVSCVRPADDVRTTHGRRADDVRMTREWDFVGDFRWQMTYVVRMSSARRLQVMCRWLGCWHIICGTPYGHPKFKLSFHCDRNGLFNGICHRDVE